ncbi:MAG TPA: CoA pyrophosphatase [Steroidobacteraceae bacterium]|nr:CoA pyrophosphatase [Steroidobacteraceae bacterium]
MLASAPANRHELRRLIEERLKDSRPPTDAHDAVPAGFSAEVAAAVRQYFPAAPVAAAVLVPLVDREEGLTVLLTQRASHLKNHAGQISFPGGRIEPGDAGPLGAALRETEEEIGLSREHVTVAGYLDPHLVLSGFWVTPVVGFVQPGFALQLDRSEVEATFEVPLLHVLDTANHQSRERMLGMAKVRVYDIPYGEHRIWGATAGMLISLYKLLQ